MNPDTADDEISVSALQLHTSLKNLLEALHECREKFSFESVLIGDAQFLVDNFKP